MIEAHSAACVCEFCMAPRSTGDLKTVLDGLNRRLNQDAATPNPSFGLSQSAPATPAAVKFDTGKPACGLIPSDALLSVARIMDIGAAKYGARNWEAGFSWTRLLSSTLRHLYAWASGESSDPETGQSHLAHAACNILFLLAHEIRGIGEDDRKPQE